MFVFLHSASHMGTMLPLILLATLCATFQARENDPTNRLLKYLMEERRGKGLEWLSELCDDFGHRMTGSVALEQAIDHTMSSLRSDGLTVHSEPVPGLPKWIRGDDRAFIKEPRLHRLSILAIGGSSPGTVEAPVVVLTNMEQVETGNFTNRIVVLNQNWMGYNYSKDFRKVAKKVAARGAVGLLVRSVTRSSIYSPHTGSGADGSPIPAACLTIEEAEMIHRWRKRGKEVVIKMDITSMPVPEPVISRNIVFEVKGSKFPSEVVLLSAHIDSWDVGQGAIDDGGGMAAMREAILAISHFARLNSSLAPKRTIRGVFWTAEEQDMMGAKQYFNDHFNRSDEKFVFVSETDQGAFKPFNYHSKLRFTGSEAQRKTLEKIVTTLNERNIPLRVEKNDRQGDVSFFAHEGIASVNYEADRGSEYYFDYHHSNGDYVNIFREGDIETTAAIFAHVSLSIANLETW